MTIPLKFVTYTVGIALAMTTCPRAWAEERRDMNIRLRHVHTELQEMRAEAVRMSMANRALAQQKRVHRVLSRRLLAAKAVRFAYRQRGKPYRWGGTGPNGYDCSGLVQRAWRSAGVHIPRVARSQYRHISTKVRRSRLMPGDLVFFRGLGHVGMYVGRGRFIHSPHPGKTVRVTRLKGYYARGLVGAARPA
jgi:cell wall-associated NlpC family hydrolase